MGHQSQRFWLAAGAAGGRAPIFPGPGSAHAQGGQSPRALLEAPPSACAEKLRPQRSAGPVLGPVRPKESRAVGAREATCGIQPAPAALARGPTGGCRVTGSQIRVEGSVRFYQALDPRERPVHVFWVSGTRGESVCAYEVSDPRERPVISAGSQIRGWVYGHPSLSAHLATGPP